jgi:hypothetical protein
MASSDCRIPERQAELRRLFRVDADVHTSPGIGIEADATHTAISTVLRSADPTAEVVGHPGCAEPVIQARQTWTSADFSPAGKPSL